MKTWMKWVLAALGFGGTGCVGGYFLGRRKGWKEGYWDGRNEAACEFYGDEESVESEEEADDSNLQKEYEDHIKDYSGDTDGDEILVSQEADTDADAEMPMETPVIGDEEYFDQIQQPALVPEIIDEHEFLSLPYQESSLVYYEQDEKLFDVSTQSVISEGEWDQTFGIGTIPLGFTKGKELLDTIYVKNDMLPWKWRIYRMDSKLSDEVPGAITTGYEEDDDDE